MRTLKTAVLCSVDYVVYQQSIARANDDWAGSIPIVGPMVQWQYEAVAARQGGIATSFQQRTQLMDGNQITSLHATLSRVMEIHQMIIVDRLFKACS
jgi:hypothetical protein